MPLALLVLAAAAPIHVAAPQFSGTHVEGEELAFFSTHFAQQLQEVSRGQIQVTTSAEIAQMLGMERQRKLLGCADNGSTCMAELANALGADAVVLGNLGRFGDTFQINVKVIRASDGQSLATYSATVEGEKSVLEGLTAGARVVCAQVLTRSGRVASVPVEALSASEPPRRSIAWVPAAVGVAAAGVGTYLLIRAASDQSALQGTGITTLANAQSTHDDGVTSQTVGLICIGAGAVGLAAAAYFYWGGTPAAVSVSATPNGPGVLVRGTFP